MTKTMLIVGAGLAGAKAAEGARDAGWSDRIVLVGDEPAAPYERPPLSKAILRREAEPDSARVHPEGFYRDHAIELVTGAVARLEAAARTVELRGGARLGFDVAVIATGATVRQLPEAWRRIYGVHHLRTMDDALRLRSTLADASRLAVVGAGWIGSEVAATARQLGVDVVLVDPLPAPLARVLGPEIGGLFAGIHAAHGVDLRLGCSVDGIAGHGRVESVVLSDGTVEDVDAVVAGIGVTPRTDVIAGVDVDDGILVDSCLETSVPGIYAAGDVARAYTPRYGTHLRVEHWATARNQGLTAGANAAGRRDQFTRLPYFFSDFYEHGIEYVGHAGADHDVTVRGDPADGRFIAFWHRDAIVDAAMHLNDWDTIDSLKAIVAAGEPIDTARLADTTAALDQLTR